MPLSMKGEIRQWPLNEVPIFALFSNFLIAIGWFAIHIPSMRMVFEDGSWAEKYNRLRDKSGETAGVAFHTRMQE